MGVNLSIYESFFGNNNPAYDYYDLNAGFPFNKTTPYVAHGENAGAMFSSSYFMIIKNCYFFKNSNMNGGGIFLKKHEHSNIQYFIIENTIFANNKAGESGASFCLAEDIGKIIGFIIRCAFLENFSNYRILFFCFFIKFLLVGGAMMLIFNHLESNVSVIESFFQSNSADMIGCIYAYQKKGIVFLKNNIFFKNFAITINRVLVGSASVLQISGIFASVFSENNYFYFNSAEYSAVIGIYYGYFRDKGSFFYG